MTDIVERLLQQVDYLPREVRQEAADEIEQLRAALEQAVDDFGEGHCVCEQTKQQCIAALTGKDTA